MVARKHFNFWLGFVFLSGLATVLSYKYFDHVTPIVKLSITADRQEVTHEAIRIAVELGWNIEGYQTAVEFATDVNLQSFVELEGGGKKAFVDMFQSGSYYPYQWKVRFFKEQEVIEMYLLFTPEGKRIGFSQKLPENMVSESLSKEQAQEIIVKNMPSWCPCFEKYQAIEYDSLKQVQDRVDHTFVYERTDLTLGNGCYRLKAKVCGNKLTKIEPFVKIPDEFTRRYQEMRSANILLALLGSTFFRILYLFMFGLFGLFYFYRRNYLLVKPAFYMALFISGLQFLSGLNDYRLWWISYNTVQASSSFIMLKIFELGLNFLVLLAIILIGLVVAEAAGRAMYKSHVNFFNWLNQQSLGSSEIFKQISLGYLCVPLMFGYEIFYTYLTENYWLWWSPSYSFSDPNVLTSYFPWFSPISLALQAGFVEEVLFRALPIAMTVVLTQKSKHKKLWFMTMFIVQAIIFGACHASYPNQPFFARLVELILPSFGFGCLYYYFGLIPGVICHFVYDAVLMTLPVMVSDLLSSQIMVVIMVGLPLWIVVCILMYNKKLYTLPLKYFNEAFHAPEHISLPLESRKIGDAIPQKNMMIVCLLGIFGFGAWMSTHHFCPDVGPLMVTKSQAIQAAVQFVQKEFGVDVSKDWQPICTVLDHSGNTESRFALQVYGKNNYQFMQGSYIQGACWLVRFVQFHRSVQDRGEEYQITVSNCCRVGNVLPQDMHPKILAMNHILPEHYHGADINQEQAENIAYQFIENNFGLQRKNLELISIADEKLKNRRNWSITMKDCNFFDFDKGGQARIQLIISGDAVTKYTRFIFVPEDWSRANSSFIMNLGIFKMILYFLMMLFIMFGFVLGVQKLLVSQYGTQMIRHKGLFVGVLVVIVSINNFCMYVGSFNTSEPFHDQIGRTALHMIVLNTLQIFFCSIFLAVGAIGFIKSYKPKYIRSFFLSIFSGLCLIGVIDFIGQYDVYLKPLSGNFIIAGSWLPAISLCGFVIKTFCLILSGIIALFLVLKYLQQKWPQQIWMQCISAILFCLSLEAMSSSESIMFMLIKSCIVGIIIHGLYRLILRYDMTLLPLVVGSLMIFDIAPELLYPSYGDAQIHVIYAIIIMIIISLFFYNRAHVE